MQHPDTSLVKFKSISNGKSFNIQSIQWVQQNNDHGTGTANSTNHFQVIWITKGNGDFWVDLNQTSFQCNQLFFVKPFQVYRLSSENQLEGYVISFTESFLEIDNQQADSTYYSNLFSMFTSARGIQIGIDLVSEIENIAGKMVSEFNSARLFRDEMLQRYLKILFVYLSRQCEGELQTTRQTRLIEITQKFIGLLDKNFKTEKSVAGYAGKLCVTANYLNEVVKKTTGYSAGHHIRQRIVLEAKRQATYSNSGMKQIGYYLGFNDMSHFSKFFKTATGMNFTDFKKEKMVVSIAS